MVRIAMTDGRVACSLMLQGSQNGSQDLQWMAAYRRQLLCRMAEKAAAASLYRRKKNANKIGNYAEQDETEDRDEGNKRKEAEEERQTRHYGNWTRTEASFGFGGLRAADPKWQQRLLLLMHTVSNGHWCLSFVFLSANDHPLLPLDRFLPSSLMHVCPYVFAIADIAWISEATSRQWSSSLSK